MLKRPLRLLRLLAALGASAAFLALMACWGWSSLGVDHSISRWGTLGARRVWFWQVATGAFMMRYYETLEADETVSGLRPMSMAGLPPYLEVTLSARIGRHNLSAIYPERAAVSRDLSQQFLTRRYFHGFAYSIYRFEENLPDPIYPAGHRSKEREFSIQFPLWFGGVIAAAIAIFLGRPFLASASRRFWFGKPQGPSPCPKCGYDTRVHSPGEKCPECGTVIPQPKAKSPPGLGA